MRRSQDELQDENRTKEGIRTVNKSKKGSTTGEEVLQRQRGKQVRTKDKNKGHETIYYRVQAICSSEDLRLMESVPTELPPEKNCSSWPIDFGVWVGWRVHSSALLISKE